MPPIPLSARFTDLSVALHPQGPHDLSTGTLQLVLLPAPSPVLPTVAWEVFKTYRKTVSGFSLHPAENKTSLHGLLGPA